MIVCDVTCCQECLLTRIFCSLRGKKSDMVSAKIVQVSLFTMFFMAPSCKMDFLTLLRFAFVYSFLLVKIFVLYILKVLTTYY